MNIDYRALVERSLVPSNFVLDPQTEGCFLHLSESAARYFGAKPAALILRRFGEFFPEFSLESARVHWRSAPADAYCFEGGPPGKRVWVSLRWVQEEGRGFIAGQLEKAAESWREPIASLEEEDPKCDESMSFELNRNRIFQQRIERNQGRELELLELALDQVSDAVFLSDDNRMLYVNEGACRALGYPRDELMDLWFSDIDADASPEALAEILARMVPEGTVCFETRHRRKNGEIFPVEVTASLFESGGKRFGFFLARDITERKRTEEALRFVAQRGGKDGPDTFLTALAQYLGKALNVDYVLVDRVADEPGFAETVALFAKGSLTHNMRYALAGTPCENVIGKNLCLYRQGIQELFPDDPLLTEMGVAAYAGIPLWDSNGQPIGLIAVMDGKPFQNEAAVMQLLQLMAVSAAAALERDESERRLRERELAFRSLAENAPDNICRYSRDLRILYLNPQMERTLGISAERLIGRNVSEKVPADVYSDYRDTLMRVIETGQEAQYEFELPDRGEGVRHHLIRMAAERDQQGRIGSVLAIGRDITESRRIEEALRDSEERMRLFFERQLVGMAITSPEKNWLQVNDKICEMLGYGKEELARLSWADLTYPEDLSSDLAQFERLVRGEIESYALEKRFVSKRGGIVFTNLSVGCVRRADRSVDYVLVLLEDITDRKRMEAEVQRHLRYFENMDRISRVIQGSNDLEAVTNEVLDAVLSIFGCDRAYLLPMGDPESDSWHVPVERTRPEYPGALAMDASLPMSGEMAARFRILRNAEGPVQFGLGTGHALPAGCSKRFGYQSVMALAIHPKGSGPWEFGIHQCSHPKIWSTDEEYLFQGMGGRLTDALTGLLAHRDLKASELKYRTLAENSPDVIVRYDRDCRRVYANPAFAQWGKSVEEALGKRPDEGSGLHTIEAYQVKLRAVLETGLPSKLELSSYKSDGSLVWGDIRFSPEFDETGNVVGVLAVGRDNTELMNSRRELAESRSLLRHLGARSESAREEERKHISRELHDELGQQVTTLRLSISMLRMQFGQDHPVLDGIAAECIQIVDAILKNVRDIVSALRPMALDMGLVAAIRWQLNQFVANTGIAGDLVVDDENIAPPESESLLIFRVLQESLTNVVRHAQAKRVHVRLRLRGNAYLLKVRDDGQGFDSTLPARRGALGLLGMRERALALGGEMNISSSPGAGTELVLKIPVSGGRENYCII